MKIPNNKISHKDEQCQKEKLTEKLSIGSISIKSRSIVLISENVSFSPLFLGFSQSIEVEGIS